MDKFRKEVTGVIEIVGSRKATPEELKNAPLELPLQGHIAIALQTHYVPDKKKSQIKI